MNIILPAIGFLVLLVAAVQCDAESYRKFLKKSADINKETNRKTRGAYESNYKQKSKYDDDDDIIIVTQDEDSGHRRGGFGGDDNSLLFLLPLLFANRGNGGLFGGGANGGMLGGGMFGGGMFGGGNGGLLG